MKTKDWSQLHTYYDQHGSVTLKFFVLCCDVSWHISNYTLPKHNCSHICVSDCKLIHLTYSLIKHMQLSIIQFHVTYRRNKFLIPCCITAVIRLPPAFTLFHNNLKLLLNYKFTRFHSRCCPDDEGKAIPLQAWTGPEGSMRLTLQDFETIGT